MNDIIITYYMKRLGQYFLINQSKIKKIVDALEIKSNDTIIEIGPGHGELTKYLLQSQPRAIITIEKDKKLARHLKQNFQSSIFNFQIIEGDVLKILPQINTKYKIQDTRYKIVGNIPYYITGKLLRIIGEMENKPKLGVFTLQKEVAQRIAAKLPRMNLLAASVQYWAEPKIIDYISKKDFQPQPNVDSAIIKLVTRQQKLVTKETDNYYKMIRILFKQPRKTILNNLSAGYKLKKEEIIEKLQEISINPDDRPQQLNLQQLKILVKMLYN